MPRRHPNRVFLFQNYLVRYGYSQPQTCLNSVHSLEQLYHDLAEFQSFAHLTPTGERSRRAAASIRPAHGGSVSVYSKSCSRMLPRTADLCLCNIDLRC